MGLYGGKTVPFSLYPADLVNQFYRKRNFNGGILETLLRMKLDTYKEKHCGKLPARIFITVEMFLEISDQIYCDVKTSAKPESKLFGIPVSLIDGEGTQIYLSDEEE